MTTADILKTYGTVGAGGLTLIVLVWLLIYLVTKINPTLEKVNMILESNKEVVKNNTEAVKEVSNSNENVASALSLLDQSFRTFTTILERHDARAEGIENDIIRIREVQGFCVKGRREDVG